ncbi:hypothetical protein [Mycolicibacterium novocastrense]|uniref:hypothetical protein n=1 Tax=Mycolicibacterium novocastrense TaxID=59813 RepID=UPI000B20817D|nr:hypothetical protein [Mycolicibacterium novocastrense]
MSGGVVETVPGAFHGFDLFAPKAGVARHFFEANARRYESTSIRRSVETDS